MNCDHYYEIGSSHKICQDFAFSGKVSKYHVAIVCDGCSMSGEHLPIETGARLVAFSACKAIADIFNQIQRDKIGGYASEFEGVELLTIRDVLTELTSTGLFFGLSARYFESTLLMAITNGHSLKIYPFGDGGFFIKKKSTDIVQFTIIEYESGAPFYLSYCLNANHKEAYMKEFGNAKVFVKTYWIDIVKKKIVGSSCYSHRANDGSSFLKKMWIYNSIDDIECVGVFSDGIQTFMNGKDNVPFAEIASEFSSFKNYNGKFVERRIANGLMKKCRQEGVHHFDDISCSVINFKNGD